jgi:hypothetical protein
MKVRREFDHVHTQLLKYLGVILFNQRTVAPVVVTNDQRFELKHLYDVPELKDAILAAAVGYDAVVEAITLMAGDHLLQLMTARVPVNLFFLELDLSANAANTELVKRNGVYRFFCQALGASFDIH